MSFDLDSKRWFLCPRSNPKAKLRIFCLHYAGGGASMYHSWKNTFTDDVELRLVQLPGRESRFSEPRPQNLSVLVKNMADMLKPYMDKPFVFFGYSMGALLAFEISRELRRRGNPQPIHLFLAAATAPHTPDVYPPLAHLPQEEFIEQVKYFFQPPEEAWKHQELLDLFLPILRDDMAIIENHKHIKEEPLDYSIDALVGLSDRGAPIENVQAWSEYTTAKFQLTSFEGGHFFLENESIKLLEKVQNRLMEIIKSL